MTISLPARTGPLLAAVLLATSLSAPALAQNPVRSLDLSVHYLDVDAVLTAAEVGIDERVAAALSDPALEHGVRLAIADALGWSVAGTDHAPSYLEHVAAAHDKAVRDLMLDDLSAAEAMSLGLLLVRDEPNTPARLEVSGWLDGTDADALLAHAAKLAPDSYAVRVAAVLVAIAPLDAEPCKADALLDAARLLEQGRRDVRDAAAQELELVIGRIDEACAATR